MERKRLYRVPTLAVVALVLGSLPAVASHLDVQCPGDVDGDAAWNSNYCSETLDPCATPGAACDSGVSGDTCTAEVQPPGVVCMHLTSGDGFLNMADGRAMYMFGFGDATGYPVDQVMTDFILWVDYPGPTIEVNENDQFYLNLSNVGMLLRPDLFDPHTVHWHGFPQASTVFDGLPESGLAINMGATLAYFYNVIEPGTYMYHCHVEATEHMQMGMLANLYVNPAQNGTPYEYPLGSGNVYTQFAYNDGDGSTGYDIDVPIQMSSFDSAFHDASVSVQPLPFALMRDDYPMLNGRGYPDTVDPDPLPLPAPIADLGFGGGGFTTTQPVSSLIEVSPGDRVLLRISNISVTRYFTLSSLSLPMTVVGRDARLLRGPTDLDLYYDTNSVTLGGGETADAIVQIPDTAVGGDTYFLYTSNLNYLNNGGEDSEGMGGMMTEIRVVGAAAKARSRVAMNGPGGTRGTK